MAENRSKLWDLRAAGKRLVPNGIAFAVVDPDDNPLGVLPEELASIPRANSKRKREFSAGRAALRQSMAAAGLQECAVPMGSDRAPVWPSGIFGSLSHSDNCAIAVCGTNSSLVAIGIDVEPDSPLECDLVEIVCQPEEIEGSNAAPNLDRGVLAKLIFSAKESAYKCQYTSTETLMGFQDFRIEFDHAKAEFSAIFTKSTGGFSDGDRLMGKYEILRGVIMTCTIDHAYGLTKSRITTDLPLHAHIDASISTVIVPANKRGPQKLQAQCIAG